MESLNLSERRVLKSILGVVAVALLSFLVALFSGKGVLIPIDEKLGAWFQRSGSVIIVLAILIDLYAYKNTSGFTELNDTNAEKRFAIGLSVMRVLMVLMPILGTLVWGYGDIIHQYLF